jgi:hypothetical protein
MNSNLLDVQTEEHSKSVMEAPSSTKSIPFMAQKFDKIKILDFTKNQEVQAMTYEELVQNCQEQKRGNCVDNEQQTDESSFFKSNES